MLLPILLYCISSSSRSNENYADSVLLVGVVTDLVFTASLHNNGPDPAYSSSIVFTHPLSLTFSRVESGSQLTCSTKSTQTTCTISGVQGQDSTVCYNVHRYSNMMTMYVFLCLVFSWLCQCDLLFSVELSKVMRVPYWLQLLVKCEFLSHLNYAVSLYMIMLWKFISMSSGGNDPIPANNEYTYSIPVRASVSPAVTG